MTGERSETRPARTKSGWGGLGVVVLLCLSLACCSFLRGSPENKSASEKPPIPEPVQVKTNDSPYREVNKGLPLSSIGDPEIYVYKDRRRLLVVDDGVLVRDYHIGLGGSPRGNKTKQGDGRTPEGRFSICVKNPGSRFYKSLGLDYPTRDHAEDALFSGVIAPGEYRRIVRALKTNQTPPWDTPMGGAIFIHGGGDEVDWTEGCIALKNRDMDELFTIVPVGAPVYVMP